MSSDIEKAAKEHALKLIETGENLSDEQLVLACRDMDLIRAVLEVDGGTLLFNVIATVFAKDFPYPEIRGPFAEALDAGNLRISEDDILQFESDRPISADAAKAILQYGEFANLELRHRVKYYLIAGEYALAAFSLFAMDSDDRQHHTPPVEDFVEEMMPSLPMELQANLAAEFGIDWTGAYRSPRKLAKDLYYVRGILAELPEKLWRNHGLARKLATKKFIAVLPRRTVDALFDYCVRFSPDRLACFPDSSFVRGGDALRPKIYGENGCEFLRAIGCEFMNPVFTEDFEAADAGYDRERYRAIYRQAKGKFWNLLSPKARDYVDFGKPMQYSD